MDRRRARERHARAASACVRAAPHPSSNRRRDLSFGNAAADQERARRGRGSRPVLEPVPSALRIHDKAQRLRARIVVTDGFDELAITGRARIRDHHAIGRGFRLAYATQADVNCQIGRDPPHECVRWGRTRSMICHSALTRKMVRPPHTEGPSGCQRRTFFKKALKRSSSQLFFFEETLELSRPFLADADEDRVRLRRSGPLRPLLGRHPFAYIRGTPGRRGSRPLFASEPICFMSLRISANCLVNWFTSATVVPEPLAILRRRDPLISDGSARSAFVIDEMMASTLRISRSASGPSGSCLATWPSPGIIFSRSPSGPIFLTCCS